MYRTMELIVLWYYSKVYLAGLRDTWLKAYHSGLFEFGLQTIGKIPCDALLFQARAKMGETAMVSVDHCRGKKRILLTHNQSRVIILSWRHD